MFKTLLFLDAIISNFSAIPLLVFTYACRPIDEVHDV